jgi:hypothetical protein
MVRPRSLPILRDACGTQRRPSNPERNATHGAAVSHTSPFPASTARSFPSARRHTGLPSSKFFSKSSDCAVCIPHSQDPTSHACRYQPRANSAPSLGVLGEHPEPPSFVPLSLAPSANRTYCATLRAMRPDARQCIDMLLRQAQLLYVYWDPDVCGPMFKLTAVIPPCGLHDSALVSLILQYHRIRTPMHANALKPTLVTASRHQDLAHRSSDVGRLLEERRWNSSARVQPGLHEAPDQVGAFIPTHHPHLANLKRHAVVHEGAAGTTPHSIRRLAIQPLERRGLTSTQISSLTNHYVKVMGMNVYRQRLPVPQARMSLLWQRYNPHCSPDGSTRRIVHTLAVILV